MIIYAGLIFVVLSSIYTFSFAKESWKNNNKLASIGSLILVFISMALALFVFMRT